jgi:hypothetical protein
MKVKANACAVVKEDKNVVFLAKWIPWFHLAKQYCFAA